MLCSASSLPEINSDAADYFDPDNVSEIENKMKLNLFDENHRKKLLQNSINRINFFNWEDTVKQTINFIKKP